MGSGVLLAILVALWFVVLVPMVVTRGDQACAPAEPMRVLRRRSDRSAMSSGMSTRDRLLSGRTVRAAEAQSMHTEPIPVLPRRVPGAALAAETAHDDRGRAKQPDRVKQVDRAKKPESESDPRLNERSVSADTDIRARRRRMLTGLVAVAVLFVGFASFWQAMFWWPQIVSDLAVFSYVVFLRLEAQREQDRLERRRARASAKVRLPEDRTERAVRKHTEYQAVITAATGNHSIALDDDDPSFAEMPTYHPSTETVVQPPAWHERKAV